MESILLYIKNVLIERKARVIQLVSRVVSGGLLAIAGQIQSQPVDTAALAGTTDAIAVAAVALAIFLLDLLIHRQRFGGFVADTPQSKGPPKYPPK